MKTEPRAPLPFVPAPLALGFWLAVVFVAAKSVHWGWPSGDARERQEWLRDLVLSSHADVAFAAGFAIAAFLLLAALRGLPRVRHHAGIALVAVGSLFALYATASVQIFVFLRAPLTYSLLYLAGDMRSMRSSIGNFVTPTVVAALLLTPALYATAVWFTSRRRGGRSPLRAVVVPAVALVGAGLWSWQGAIVADGSWSDRPDLLIAESPHWELLASLARELRGGDGIPKTDDNFPREYLSDFRPASPRLLATDWKDSALPSAHPRRFNVIEVVLESTGARYLSLYGSPYRTTPNLEAQSSHALVFDNFYAHVGFTANSLFALTLSQHPYMTWREYTQEYPDFPGTTVGEVLKPLGYKTAFLTTGYLDYVCMDCFLKNRGFDEVRDWKTVGGGDPGNSWGGDEARLVDRTLDWIDHAGAQPFYLMLWTQQTHHPYEPSAGQPIVDFFAGHPLPDDDYDLGRYLNALAHVDHALGRLFEGLERSGHAKDTIVVITGDHGEAFGSPHRTWGHGFRLFQEGIRVPFMIWSPTLVSAGRRIDTIGGHVDVNPTILDMLGVPPPAAWEGRSLFAADRVPRVYFYAANDDYLLGIREDQYKYIYNVTRGREELYDLRRDPDEQVNIAAAHADRCRVWRSRLAAWKHQAAGQLAAAREEMDRRHATASTRTIAQVKDGIIRD